MSSDAPDSDPDHWYHSFTTSILSGHPTLSDGYIQMLHENHDVDYRRVAQDVCDYQRVAHDVCVTLGHTPFDPPITQSQSLKEAYVEKLVAMTSGGLLIYFPCDSEFTMYIGHDDIDVEVLRTHCSELESKLLIAHQERDTAIEERDTAVEMLAMLRQRLYAVLDHPLKN